MNNLMLKKNKNKGLLILLISLLISGWFYWYELRPARIRHDCSWIQQSNDKTHWDPVFKPNKSYNEHYNGYYDFCIKEKGLTR